MGFGPIFLLLPAIEDLVYENADCKKIIFLLIIANSVEMILTLFTKLVTFQVEVFIIKIRVLNLERIFEDVLLFWEKDESWRVAWRSFKQAFINQQNRSCRAFGVATMQVTGAVPESKVNSYLGIGAVKPELPDYAKQLGVKLLNRVLETLLREIKALLGATELRIEALLGATEL